MIRAYTKTRPLSDPTDSKLDLFVELAAASEAPERAMGQKESGKPLVTFSDLPIELKLDIVTEALLAGPITKDHFIDLSQREYRRLGKSSYPAIKRSSKLPSSQVGLLMKFVQNDIKDVETFAHSGQHDLRSRRFSRRVSPQEEAKHRRLIGHVSSQEEAQQLQADVRLLLRQELPCMSAPGDKILIFANDFEFANGEPLRYDFEMVSIALEQTVRGLAANSHEMALIVKEAAISLAREKQAPSIWLHLSDREQFRITKLQTLVGEPTSRSI